jgi:hypothetical protein
VEAYGFQSDSWRVSSLQAPLMWERLTVISAVKPSLIVAVLSDVTVQLAWLILYRSLFI